MQENPPNLFFNDGAVTKVALGNKYVDRSMLLKDDIYGGAIPEGDQGNIFKYKVTDFYDEEEKFTPEYSAQAIKKNLSVWIDFTDDERLMLDISVKTIKYIYKKSINAMGCIKVKMLNAEAEAKTVLLYFHQR